VAQLLDEGEEVGGEDDGGAGLGAGAEGALHLADARGSRPVRGSSRRTRRGS